MFRILSLLLCLSVVSFAQPSKPQAVRKIISYVTDETGTLTASQSSSLETKLSAFEKETSTQVVLYIIKSLEGESLEEKSYEFAEKNGIGQKGKNNGVLLFIAIDDRKLRIEVGYGLEGALPDALCGQIIRKEITPYFKQGKYYEGIDAGVNAIMKATKGEYTQETTERGNKGIGVGVCGIPVLFTIVIFLFVFFIIIRVIRSIFPFGRHRRYIGGSGFRTGGSSSYSGGSSFSGGFSGGGGSFGGGGASGSW